MCLSQGSLDYSNFGARHLPLHIRNLVLHGEGKRLRMSENEILKKALGSKREEAREKWRKLFDEDLHCSYSSQHIIGVTSDACEREEKCIESYGWENLKEKVPLQELSIEGKIILKLTLFSLDIIKTYAGVSHIFKL